jgi:hypothetical protein
VAVGAVITSPTRNKPVPFEKFNNSSLVPYLLPIIPAGATLSPGSQLQPDKIGKIPGEWTERGWRGFKDWQKNITTNKLLEAFARFYTHEPELVESIGCRRRIRRPKIGDCIVYPG